LSPTERGISAMQLSLSDQERLSAWMTAYPEVSIAVDPTQSNYGIADPTGAIPPTLIK